MKSTSVLVLLMFFFCAQASGAIQGPATLANAGIYAAFDSSPAKSSELIRENKFSPMTMDIAEKIGVSKGQMESYNRDVDLLNAMMSEISSELAAMKRPTLDDAVGLWSGLKGAVSSTTLEALRKITKAKTN